MSERTVPKGLRPGDRFVLPITTTLFGRQWEVWESRGGPDAVPDYIGAVSTEESARLLAFGPRAVAALEGFAFTVRDGLPCFCRYVIDGQPEHNPRCQSARLAVAAVRGD